MLSIVIPVYNAEKYLSACIDSVLSQTFSDFELILLNDGSSDGSGEICRQYARRDKRIVTMSQKNQGQAAARNRGMGMARGKYIGFCDNDDVLCPDHFKTLVGNIIPADADISACSYMEKHMDGHLSHEVHTEKMYHFSNQAGMSEYLSREKMDIYVWTKIYKRQFLEENKICFEVGRSDEDFLFNYQAFLYAQKTVFMDQALYVYHVRQNSESRIFYKKNLRKYLHNTLYRTYKIESLTREKYPELLPLAKRQTILYDMMMLGRIVRVKGYIYSEPYFSYIMRYLRKNKNQVIHERTKWGMSLPGVCILVSLPSGFYYRYRRFIATVKGWLSSDE